MALKYDSHQSPSFWIGLTNHLLEGAINRKLAPAGIPLRQVQVLAALFLYGERSQVELADDLRIEPSTVVRVLDRMERDGWIERHPAPDDRRKKLIRPTAKVEPTWQEIIRLGEEVKNAATAGLSAKELKTLPGLLERIRTNLETSSQVAARALDGPVRALGGCLPIFHGQRDRRAPRTRTDSFATGAGAVRSSPAPC